MSEWKWCQNCQHHLTAHRGNDDIVLEVDTFVSFNGRCVIEGCGCEQGYFDLADLL